MKDVSIVAFAASHIPKQRIIETPFFSDCPNREQGLFPNEFDKT
jgi:hypothetical protein